MKKKLFALLMAGVMAMSFTTAAFAEAETEEPAEAEYAAVLNWEDFEEQIADNESWAGDFFDFEEIALKMYVPAAFEEIELTEEDTEAGYIAYFMAGEDAAVGVQYVDMDGMELADYAALLTEEYGVTDADWGLVNGIEAISYTNPDDESVAVMALATQMGYIMEFSFAPINDESFAAVATVMMASIQEA